MTLGDRIVVLRDGIIQQIGRPVDVYDRPVNRFVVSFLGTPPMNFMAGRLAVERGTAWFVDGALKLGLQVGDGDRLGVHSGADVELGIRAEKLEVRAEPAGGENTFTGRVEMTEPLGSHTLLHFRVMGRPLVAIVDAHRQVRVGQELELLAPREHLHVFDRQSGSNLSVPQARTGER